MQDWQDSGSKVISGFEFNKRFDVCYSSYDARLIPGQKYGCRFMMGNDSTGLYSFILDDSHVLKSTYFAMQVWTEFYLLKDISKLKLNHLAIKKNQMVVVVDKKAEQVYRGLYRGYKIASPTDKQCLVYCFDKGNFVSCPLDSLYATTDVVAKTESVGFQCHLDYITLFWGTPLLAQVIDKFNKQYFPPGLEHGSSFTLQVKRFNSSNVPVVDIWAVTSERGKLCGTPLNQLFGLACLEELHLGTQSKKNVGFSFEGTVAHVSDTGRLFVHTSANGIPSPVSQMDKYLNSFDIEELEFDPKLTRFSKSRLAEPKMVNTFRSKMFIGLFLKDNRVYRCKILDAYNSGVYVIFIDYGRNGFISYDYLFDAKEIDPFLEMVPPLVFECHMCSVDEPNGGDGQPIYNYFQKLQALHPLHFTIRDGFSGSVHLVSIMSKGMKMKGNGGKFDVVSDLIESHLVTLRRKRCPSGGTR